MTDKQVIDELQSNLSTIIEEITGGLLSKPGYSPEIVLDIYKQRQSEKINRLDAYNDLSTILKNSLGDIYTDGLDEIIREYFGVARQD